MKLTFAVMSAFIKYPRPAFFHAKTEGRASQKKFGFFQTEKDTFQAIAQEIELGKPSSEKHTYLRHPLAFLVEASDNICYHIIDLEDGTRLGFISYPEFEELMANVLGKSFNASKLKKYSTKEEKLAVLRALAINKLTEEVAEVFVEQETNILAGKFDKDLFEELYSKPLLDQIIGLTIERYYRCKPVLEIEASGFEVIWGLLEMVIHANYNVLVAQNHTKRDLSIFRLMPEFIRIYKKRETTPYQVCRLSLDFISGLSDKAAVLLYKKLKGLNL